MTFPVFAFSFRFQCRNWLHGTPSAAYRNTLFPCAVNRTQRGDGQTQQPHHRFDHRAAVQLPHAPLRTAIHYPQKENNDTLIAFEKPPNNYFTSEKRNLKDKRAEKEQKQQYHAHRDSQQTQSPPQRITAFAPFSLPDVPTSLLVGFGGHALSMGSTAFSHIHLPGIVNPVAAFLKHPARLFRPPYHIENMSCKTHNRLLFNKINTIFTNIAKKRNKTSSQNHFYSVL